MKYLAGIFLTGAFVYILSFSLHNWKRHSYFAAVGSALLAVATVVLGFLALFFGNFEH
ncbi:MAG: hypothetical protein QM401_04650 [Bacillota bacterium]|nr:hypothetical protein [Bacillota bacterium]HHU60512.1 hypothetical protein [Natronincola sp.]